MEENKLFEIFLKRIGGLDNKPPIAHTFGVIGKTSNSTSDIELTKVHIGIQAIRYFEDPQLLKFDGEIPGTIIQNCSEDIAEIWVEMFDEYDNLLTRVKLGENMTALFQNDTPNIVDIVIQWELSFSEEDYFDPFEKL